MGAVSIDRHRKERLYDAQYPTDLPDGVRATFENIDRLHRAAYEHSDFDALNVLLDFERAVADARLTEKQRQAVALVYGEGLTQEEAAVALGVTQPSLKERLDNAMSRVARAEGYDEEAFVEWSLAWYGKDEKLKSGNEERGANK